ncbi:AhpC/TSA family protein [Mucilaginibacter robiniae]|uniref:AhpC/TSA family protein n=1 Tax=Mucilaginibacter robiniae TaxID=2728022 RepID=A0A7L5E1Q6_9SPHI|nr:AhpC/TSA family protein [Mucilaginibacter robiniae]QJD96448.1 AhpC/TSA family protein [Mucilaginibacter robiniae]
MKKIIVFTWLVVLFGAVASILWYNQYKYSLPTPVPDHYVPVKNGTAINLGFQFSFENHKPVLLHFFNPDCPCSKFNIKHVKELITQYGNQVNFAVVLLTDKYYTPAQVKQKYDLHIPVVVAPQLAIACGVYSTPQAAILNSSRQLYYRGNYNNSRYCTDSQTAYARIALENLLKQHDPIRFSLFATRAYGCSLPGCKL